MYCKIVWCYTFILTLLDITLNIKLTAQGKSHGKIDFTALEYFHLVCFYVYLFYTEVTGGKPLQRRIL